MGLEALPPGYNGKDDPVWATIGSWGHALGHLFQYVTGTGSTSNTYGPGSTEANDMQHSTVACHIRDQLRGLAPGHQGPVPDPKVRPANGFGDETYGWTLMEPTNGTQAQIGSVKWNANICGDQDTITLTNQMNLNSLLYHRFDRWHWGGWQRTPGGFGPFGNVDQTITWTEPMPR